MKERRAEDHSEGNGKKRSKSSFRSMKNTNFNNNNNKKKRLGGGGLPLEAFANAKTKSRDYNPALIKKQRELYKNAKQVSKYKKFLKQQSETGNNFLATTDSPEDNCQDRKDIKINEKNKKKGMHSLRELYEKKHEEDEKAKMEREATIQAKKEAREKTEARRKAVREKMLKKTRSGQPVMKYRIENLLQNIQGSTD